MNTKALSDALFALRSPGGLRVGDYVVRAEHPLSLRLVYADGVTDVRFDPPLSVDHSSWIADKLADGELYAIRFRRDGKATAYVELTLPLGRKKDIEVAL